MITRNGTLFNEIGEIHIWNID